MAVSPAPAVIAASANRARREITGHFMQMNAVAPGDAVAFAPNAPLVRRQFDNWLARGVVKQAGRGLYWLDIPAYNADMDARRRRLVPIVIALMVIAAALLTLAYRG